MNFKWNPFHEVRIYIGSREAYDGPAFTREDLLDYIGQVQEEAGDVEANPVRVTETLYAWQDYREAGWEVAVIGYPRRPKAKHVIDRFALTLAESLLKKFRQNRVSVVFPDEIVMLEEERGKTE